MEGKREISEPVGRQSPDVTSWRQSLRNSKKGKPLLMQVIHYYNDQCMA